MDHDPDVPPDIWLLHPLLRLDSREDMGHHFNVSDRADRTNNSLAVDTLSKSIYYSVKKEPGSPNTPKLHSPATTGLHHYQFHFRTQPHFGGSGSTQVPSSGQNSLLYRFGSESPLMSNSWPSSSSVPSASVDLASMQHTMSFNDYEDAADEITELPPMQTLSGRPNSVSVSHEKTIRRRSSKGTLH